MIFSELLRYYLVRFYDLLSMDCYLSIWRTLRILFHCIVTLVSRTLLRLSSDGLLHSYLVHFKDSLLLDCYVGISRTFRIPIQWIVTLLSRALLRSSFNGLVP